MKHPLLPLIVVLFCMGCRTPKQEWDFEQPYILQGPFEQVSPPSMAPCPQQLTTTPTSSPPTQAVIGATTTGTISASAITLEDITRVDVKLLQDTLRRAIAKATYPVDRTIAPTVSETVVTLITEPIPSGAVFFRHYVTAEIHSKDIELTVRSVLLDQNRNLLNNLPPNSVPEKVHADIIAALMSRGTR